MLGWHVDHIQRRWIYGVPIGTAVVILVAFLVWPNGSQKPTRHPSDDPQSPHSLVAPIGATTTTTKAGVSVPNGTKSQVSGGISGISSTGSIAVPPTTTTIPAAGITTTTEPAGTTTTVPPGAIVDYAAYVSPVMTQNATNPLEVTYSYSAGASTVVNGVNLELANLPSGTLSLSANGTQQCAMSVGAAVSGGTCSVTYPTFGGESMVATYTTGGTGYSSDPAVDDVEPFATTTVAGITGGGSLGGLIFFASVMDANDNSITTGNVSLTIADTTEGWSYVVNGTVGPDGAHQSDFGCALVGNYPSVGEYSGCGLSDSFVVTPQDGDLLTEIATFAGTTDWDGSTSSQVTYTMP